MSEYQVALNGTTGWITTDSDFSLITVVDSAGDIATIARPLGGSLLGADIGFGVLDGVPYYDPISVEPGETTTFAADGAVPALSPDAGGDLVLVPTG